MSAVTDELLPGERPPAPGPAAPPLPIEAPVVQAALALREARDQVNMALWLLANSPRDPQAEASITAAWNRLSEAHAAFTTYRNVLTCAGSA